MHRGNIDIGIAGDSADGAEQARAVEVVAEHEIAFGRVNINPVVVHPHDVRGVLNQGGGNDDFAAAAGHLDGNQVDIISAGNLFLLQHGEAAPGGDEVGVDQIDALLAYLSQQTADDGRLEDIGIVV